MGIATQTDRLALGVKDKTERLKARTKVVMMMNISTVISVPVVDLAPHLIHGSQQRKGKQGRVQAAPSRRFQVPLRLPGRLRFTQNAAACRSAAL